MRTVKQGIEWLDKHKVWDAASDPNVPGWARSEVALTRSRMSRMKSGESLLKWFWSAIVSPGGKKLGAELRKHKHPSFEGVYLEFTRFMLS